MLRLIRHHQGAVLAQPFPVEADSKAWYIAKASRRHWNPNDWDSVAPAACNANGDNFAVAADRGRADTERRPRLLYTRSGE